MHTLTILSLQVALLCTLVVLFVRHTVDTGCFFPPVQTQVDILTDKHSNGIVMVGG